MHTHILKSSCEMNDSMRLHSIAHLSILKQFSTKAFFFSFFYTGSCQVISNMFINRNSAIRNFHSCYIIYRELLPVIYISKAFSKFSLAVCVCIYVVYEFLFAVANVTETKKKI